MIGTHDSRRVVTDAMAGCALGLAVLAYLALRDGLVLHLWLRDLVGDHAMGTIRSAGGARAFPPWVKFSAPDGLWQFAFCLVMLRIWRGAAWTSAKVAWCALPVVIGLGVEIGQAFHWVAGTFDPIDLLASVVAIGAAFGFNASIGTSRSREALARGSWKRSTWPWWRDRRLPFLKRLDNRRSDSKPLVS